MGMRVASLASGSSGNSYYIESDGGALLVDAGLSAKAVLHNLELAGGDPAKVAGIVVTHDHRDHVAGVGVLQRRFGWKLWMTSGTFDAASPIVGRIEAELVAPGSGFMAAGMTVELYPTPHDSQEPVAIVLSEGRERCGVFTDLGHVFPGLADALEGLDFVFLESNYDPEMLKRSRKYHYALKARIRGAGGHIANAEAAELVRGLSGGRLRRIVLSHLSEETNTPETAYACFAGAMAGRIPEQGIKVGVAPRHSPMRLAGVVE